MIKVLNGKGIHVAGVGSFHAEQLVGVSTDERIVGGEAKGKAKAVRFFHVVQRASEKAGPRRVANKQRTMFNAACLLEPERSNPMKPSYSVRTSMVRAARAHRRGA